MDVPPVGSVMPDTSHGMLAYSIVAGRDLFEIWRLLLTTICTIYAALVTARSFWRMCVLLTGPRRIASMMRSYLLLQVLRLRLRRFAWEFAQIGLWLVILVMLLYVQVG